MSIEKTKDYSKFSTLKGNRELKKFLINKIERSIMEGNMLHSNPIIVNEKFEVIDGQHRLAVAERNELDIYYIIVPGITLNETVALNTASSGWGVRDYINSYASRGNKNYRLLQEFCERYGIAPTVAAKLMSDGRIEQGGGTSKLIKSGDFRANRYDETVKFADDFLTIKRHLPRFAGTRNFIAALKEFLDRDYVSSDKLEKSVAKYKNNMERQDSVADYLKLFEAIYE